MKSMSSIWSPAFLRAISDASRPRSAGVTSASIAPSTPRSSTSRMYAFLSGASASFRRKRYVLGKTRRSLMPVRWVIHSSDVVKQRASRWLSTTQSGTAIPVPMILALRITAFRVRRG